MKKIAILSLLFFAISGVAFAETDTFTDVPSSHWASSILNVLKTDHIIQGYEDGSFKPDASVSRAEVAQMIYNEHMSMERELKQKQTEDSITTTTVANTLPSVVVIRTSDGLGAGVFIDSKHVLTANHVVDSDSKIMVKTISGNQYEGKIISSNQNVDLALLEVNTPGETITPIHFAQSYAVGETAIAIGHPDGLNYSVSKGIISFTNRQIDNNGANLIQVDTAISPGNSGGPLVDIDGNLIGIVNEKISGKATEGIGFAVSLDEIKKFINK